MSREYCSTSAEYHEAVHHTAWTPKLRMSSQYMQQRERNQQDTQHSGQSQPPKEEAEQNTRPLQPHIYAEDDIDSEPEDLKLEQQHAEFYDSGADDKDEEWMLAQRQGRHSDAILSCPGCLTTVCIDCQRHEFYTTQYRAMFVMNCRYVSSFTAPIIVVENCLQPVLSLHLN